VLEKCLVVILIVDGRYGTPLEWNNFKEVFGAEKLSPTHGEYRYARHKKKRLLIFIRESLMNDYGRYREAIKEQKVKEPCENLKKQLFLPAHINFDALRFIEEIKTQPQVPWVRIFRDVTEVKREVHRQLLNELARWFVERENKMLELIGQFSRALEVASPEQRQEILKQIGFTKDLIDAVEEKSESIAEAKLDLDEKENAIQKLGKEKAINHLRISELESEISALKARIKSLSRENTENIIETGAATGHESDIIEEKEDETNEDNEEVYSRRGLFETDEEFRDRIALEEIEKLYEESTGSSPQQGFLEAADDYYERIRLEANELIIQKATGYAPKRSFFESDHEYRERIDQEVRELGAGEDGEASGWQ
jgi:hypothetical protein